MAGYDKESCSHNIRSNIKTAQSGIAVLEYAVDGGISEIWK